MVALYNGYYTGLSIRRSGFDSRRDRECLPERVSPVNEGYDVNRPRSPLAGNSQREKDAGSLTKESRRLNQRPSLGVPGTWARGEDTPDKRD